MHICAWARPGLLQIVYPLGKYFLRINSWELNLCLKDRRLSLHVAILPRVKTVPVYVPVTVRRGLSLHTPARAGLTGPFCMGWYCIASAVSVQNALQAPKKAWGKSLRNV